MTRRSLVPRRCMIHCASCKSRGAFAGFDSPATLIPSAATQRTRRAALPEEAMLRERLTQALTQSALRAEAFEPFIADVQRARQLEH